MKTTAFWQGAIACVLLAAAAARADESTVEQCSKSFGTLAVAESQNGWPQLAQYGLGSPAAILRMMVQKSGCFDVVERGVAMQNLQQERAMAQSGELRQESNVGKGQMQAADFVMTPNVQIGAKTTGGVGGGLGGLLRGVGPLGAVLGGVSGGLKFKEASTSLLIADVRSGLQVAAAEGQASKTDFSVSGWGFNGLAVGGASGFTNSPEGKVVAASFLDNYNKMVVSIRGQQQLIRPSSMAGDNNAAVSTRAQSPQAAGEMLAAKIANVKVYEAPRTTSKVIATLRRTDELVATGEVENGFIKVDAADFSGWVQRTLVAPISSGPRSEAAPTPAPAQPATTQLVGNVLPRGMSGLFYGVFYGPDQGDFQVTVLDNGMVSGTGRSGHNGNFGISGNVAPTGAMQMTSAGQAGGAQFVGTIEPSTGRVVGSWYVNGANQGGTFAGQRR